MGEEVWTEILGSGLVATWAWDGYCLGVIITPMEGTHLTHSTVQNIDRYADDKELNLVVREMYDDSDFDGTIKEFTREKFSGGMSLE